MTSIIPDAYLDLLENPVVVTVVTVMPDGQPQATPVWCKWDGENIIVNTAVGRQKHENVLANPKVTVCAVDPENPYRYLEVRGTATLSEEGAEVMIDELAQAYVNKPHYYGEGGVVPESGREQRINIVITPNDTSQQGS